MPHRNIRSFFSMSLLISKYHSFAFVKKIGRKIPFWGLFLNGSKKSCQIVDQKIRRTKLRSIVNRENTSKKLPRPIFERWLGVNSIELCPLPLLLNELVTLYQMRRLLCCYCTLHKSGEFHERKIFVGQCCNFEYPLSFYSKKWFLIFPLF